MIITEGTMEPIWENYALKLELQLKEKQDEIDRLNKKIDEMIANGIMLYFKRAE